MELIGPYLAGCVLLVVAGTTKAVRPADTARGVAGTLRLTPGLVRPVVRAVAIAEALLGVVAIARPSLLTAGLVAGSYLGFAVFVRVTMARGGPLASCGCFATPDTPATATHVIIDLVLAVSACCVALATPGDWLPLLLAGQPWSGVPLIGISLLCAGLAYLSMTRLALLGAARRSLGIVRGGPA